MPTSSEVADVFVGGGEMGALMRSLDWSRTPLGPVGSWPQSLKTSVSICLASRFPILIWWGPQLVKLYNDAYASILGDKHPRAIGAPGHEIWPEIWDIIGPMLAGVRERGEATWSDDQMLPLRRKGYTEECYFTFSYSPIRDESGGVGGIFTAVTETTERVVGARRLATLREVAASTLKVQTAEAVCAAAAATLAENPTDLPFALIYLVDGEGRHARLAGVAGLEAAAPSTPATVDLGTDDLWLLTRAVRDGPFVLRDLNERFGDLPGGPWPEPSHTAVVLPIEQAGQGRPAGVLVAGVSPRREMDDAYRDFLDLVAGQLASGIADARAYEAERRRAEALAELDRAKTTFFSNVSHEFRTPLTLMLGPLEDVLGQDDGLSFADRERLTVAHRNAVRLLRLVNTLLDFSRIEAGRAQASYEPIDLPRFTAELASTFRSALERAGLALVIDCPPLPDGVAAYVDREMWEKIVLNLLSNAFKFTFAGEIEVALSAIGDHLRLVVRDTGTGIAADELPRLFERFHRVEGTRARTQEGTGIGLALVRELVELHGGRIRVESTPGSGTTFAVTLPAGSAHLPTDRIGAARTAASTALGSIPYLDEAFGWLSDEQLVAADRPAASEIDATDSDERTGRGSDDRGHAGAGARPRILVADDNRDMREYVARLLRPDYEVEAVMDGELALAAARAHPPDLVVSDIMMPGLDGFGLVAALRADSRTQEVPIILLSARAGEEARIDGVQAGADDYVVKPFSAKELLARIEGRLDLARLRARAREQEDAARKQLESLFLQAPAAICLFHGPEHVYTLANPRYLDLVGGREVVGKPIREALPELDGQGIYELLDRVYATGEAYVGAELPVQLDSDGSGVLDVVYFNFVYAPLCDVDGRVEGIFVHAYEISDQVRARQATEAATRAQDEFLSIASHELRNPVAGIKGTAQLLRRLQRSGRLDDERLERYLTSIEAGSNRLTTLTEDLLDVSRLQQGVLPLRLRKTDLAALIRDVVSRLPEHTRHRVRTDLADDIEPLLVDPDRVEQILVNLIDNAAKYSPGHGPIGVSLERTGTGLTLQVRDQGIGLPVGAAERIFRPFGRAANAQAANIPGLGLGLYICRQIAEQHGGRLWAASDGEHRGTTLTLWLPPEPGDA